MKLLWLIDRIITLNKIINNCWFP